MLNKVFGVIVIIISVGIVAKLIPQTINLVGVLADAIKFNKGYYWGSFTFDFLLSAVLWVGAYYFFRFGRKLYKQ